MAVSGNRALCRSLAQKGFHATTVHCYGSVMNKQQSQCGIGKQLPHSLLDEATSAFLRGEAVSPKKRQEWLKIFHRPMSFRRAERIIILHAAEVMEMAGRDLRCLVQAWLTLGKERFTRMFVWARKRLNSALVMVYKGVNELNRPINLKDIFRELNRPVCMQRPFQHKQRFAVM